MANTSSAKKKVRVIERKTLSREMYKNKIKTYIKKVESLISEKDQKSASELLKKVDPKLQASKNKKIFSKQSGEQRFGGFSPIEDATTENLVTDEEIINDNINNNY